MTISEFCFSLNNETTTLHKHPNTSFYPFSFNSPSDIVFRPYNLTLEGKQLDSFICEKRNFVEKENGYKFLICANPYISKRPYAKYITIEEYFASKKKEKKKMTINELCDLLNKDTNHLKTKGFHHWSVFTSDFQEKEHVNCWSFVLDLEVEKLNDFIRAKRDVVKEAGFELTIIPKHVSNGEWQIIPADEYLEKNKKTTINELVAKLNNEIHSDSFSCNDLTPENSIVFNPHRDRACEGETFFSFTCFICEKRNLVEKEGFKLLISDNGKYLTVDEYLEGKKKKLVNGLVAKLNKETRKKNIDNDTHAFNFNSVDFQDAKLRTDFKDNIVFYPITVSLTGQELDSFICEKRNLVEKEGYKFLINDSKSGKYLTINEYFDLKKNKTQKELCDEFNKEAKNIYKCPVPYPFTCGSDGSNEIVVYPNMICANKDKPTGFKDFIVGAETIVKQNGYELIVNACCVGVPDDGCCLMPVSNYLKKSIKEVYDEIEKEAKKRFKECVASCSEFGSKITIYPKISGDGIISNDFIVEAKNKVEKEGYKFVVCYNSKDMSFDEYFDLRKIEKMQELCLKLNNEAKEKYKRVPFSFNEKTNRVYIYPYQNGKDIPNDFIIESRDKVEKEGYEFVVACGKNLTVDEYLKKTNQSIDDFCNEINRVLSVHLEINSIGRPYAILSGFCKPKDDVVEVDINAIETAFPHCHNELKYIENRAKDENLSIVFIAQGLSYSSVDQYSSVHPVFSKGLKQVVKFDFEGKNPTLHKKIMDSIVGTTKEAPVEELSKKPLTTVAQHLEDFQHFKDELYTKLCDPKAVLSPDPSNCKEQVPETLPNTENLDKVSDIKYFKDKLYSTLNVPNANSVIHSEPLNTKQMIGRSQRNSELDAEIIQSFKAAEQLVDFLKLQLPEGFTKELNKDQMTAYEQGMKHENWSKYWGTIKLNNPTEDIKIDQKTNKDYPPGELAKESTIKLRKSGLLQLKADMEARRVKKYDLLRLIGTQGIVDITDVDNPEGVTVVEIRRYGCNTAEIYKLGYKVREVKSASFFQSLKEDWRYLPKFNKYILSGSLATILLAPIIFTCVEFGKIPVAISSKIIHQGVLEKIEDNKYTFKDGSSFILEKDKVTDIISKGVDVELVQDIWGNYRFERQ